LLNLLFRKKGGKEKGKRAITAGRRGKGKERRRKEIPGLQDLLVEPDKGGKGRGNVEET